MLKDFIALIFPNTCNACGHSLYRNEDCICTRCRYKLPQTNYHLSPSNPVSKLFWGRVPINTACAYYNFNKGGSVQRLVHQLKYRGKQEIGVTIGKFYGSELRKSILFRSVNLIMPVPLHSKKLKKRGFNQSEVFAQGLARSMDIEFDPGSLQRIHASETQTRRSRYERWKNVESIFAIKDRKKLEGKHILLVDDVVTTGATLEACAQELLSIPGTMVSIAAIAYSEV